MRKNVGFGIISFIVIVLFTGCTSIYQKSDSKAQETETSKQQNFRIDKAGDLNNKPYTTNTNTVSNVANKNNKQIQVSKQGDKTIFRLGDKGKQVEDIQQKLSKFGYNVNKDGNYGEQTEYIVMDFQFKHNLEIDGIVSGKTLEMLNKNPDSKTKYNAKAQSMLNASSAANASSYEDEVNNAGCQSYTDYLIMVSISSQQVYIFNGKPRSWKLINTFPCASGREETPTIKGNFYIGDKGPEFTPGNGVHCKYYSQISGNYLFHSILYDSNGNVIDSTLGETASHGCVRLALENAKYIYDNIPIGSGVWIH